MFFDETFDLITPSCVQDACDLQLSTDLCR